MFENLHLHYRKFEPPATPRNFYSQYPELADYTPPKNDTSSTLLNCDYCMDGYVYESSTFPISDYAYENLLSIKAFSLMHSKKQYFTRRQNEDSYLILFTYEGNGVMEYAGKKYTLSKGEGMFISCQHLHYYKSANNDWVHADLHIHGKEIKTFYDIFQDHQAFRFQQATTGNFQNILEELIELYVNVTPYRELLISGKINLLLTTLLTSSDFFRVAAESMPENLQYLLRYIQNFYHKNLTLDSLSDFSGISKPHLIRLFNKHVGCSPHEYILRLQIENAKQLLENTTLSAAQIGRMVGIENSNYFNHFFKTRVGIPPGEYRHSKKEHVVSV